MYLEAYTILAPLYRIIRRRITTAKLSAGLEKRGLCILRVLKLKLHQSLVVSQLV